MKLLKFVLKALPVFSGSENASLQCWFKLTVQNAFNLKFETRFSQIGFSLGENLWRQNLLKRHNYIKVSLLSSPTNFKKGIFSKKN